MNTFNQGNINMKLIRTPTLAFINSKITHVEEIEDKDDPALPHLWMVTSENRRSFYLPTGRESWMRWVGAVESDTPLSTMWLLIHANLRERRLYEASAGDAMHKCIISKGGWVQRHAVPPFGETTGTCFYYGVPRYSEKESTVYFKVELLNTWHLYMLNGVSWVYVTELVDTPSELSKLIDLPIK